MATASPGQFRDYDGQIRDIRTQSREPRTVLFHGNGIARLDFPAGNPRRRIVISCGSEFGTGNHPSTALVLDILEIIARRVRQISVLDYGCGTGIIGIACSTLGARSVSFVDRRPSAVQIAMKNARAHASRSRFRGRVARTPVQSPAARFQLVIANLVQREQLKHLRGFATRLTPGGCLVLSGIKKEACLRLVNEARAMGLRMVLSREVGCWTALLLVRRPCAHSILPRHESRAYFSGATF